VFAGKFVKVRMGFAISEKDSGGDLEYLVLNYVWMNVLIKDVTWRFLQSHNKIVIF
jgi:hypothetical protein